MFFGSALTLMTFILVVVVVCFNSSNHFFLLFQKIPKFRFRVLRFSVNLRVSVKLSVSIRVRVMVRFRVYLFSFRTFLSSLLHSRHAFLSCYTWLLNKVSNTKNNRRFCSHCLFTMLTQLAHS